MKKMKYLLAAAMICLSASCGSPENSMQDYVTRKMNEYAGTCVKFNRLTQRDDALDLSKCHPLAYYRTLTSPSAWGEIHECVAIRYQEGVLYAVSGSGAMYFWDNDMLTATEGIISAIATDDNYWLPAIVSGGVVADYRCIAAGTNPRRAGLSIDMMLKQVREMGLEKVDESALPLIVARN